MDNNCRGDAMGKWLSITLLACSPTALALDQAELAALLENARAEMNMPSLRAAVRMADGRIVRAAVGLADIEADTSLDDTVGMPGGSTGKTFVAVLTKMRNFWTHAIGVLQATSR